MYTYIMKSVDLHKIGKAINPQERLKGFQTGNPYIELIKTIQGNHERALHQKFKDKRVTGEWFKLTQEDIDSIETPTTEQVNKIKDVERELLSYIVVNYNSAQNIVLSPLIKDKMAKEWGVEIKDITDALKYYINKGIIKDIGYNTYHYCTMHPTRATIQEERRPKIRLSYDEEGDKWITEIIEIANYIDREEPQPITKKQ